MGRVSAPESGATMPKPSVALCSPKPMIRTSASVTWSCAADCPIASPSEKLCSPMPVAISSASQDAGESPATHEGSNSAADAAPGPSIALLRWRPNHRS